MRTLFPRFFFFLWALIGLASTGFAADPHWVQVDIGTIDVASEDMLAGAIATADQSKADGLLITLDSDGGSLSSTREMVKDIIASPVPVVVWVGPSGAHAGSAGAFITLAGHIAAMSPASNIGAAHPVESDGANIDDDDSDLRGKIENDTAAFIESIAELRGRDKSVAASLVMTSLALSADEALQHKLIDRIASDPHDLLDKLDGLPLKLNATKNVTIKSKGAAFVPYTMTAKQQALEVLSNPDLFYLLFVGGLLGLALEILHPGSVVPGVAGAFALILALISGSILPINIGASVLILASLAFMVAEIFVPSFGVLGIGGLLGFVVGSMLLVDTKNSYGFGISLWTIVPTALGLVAVIAAVALLGLRSQKHRIVSGSEGLIGSLGTAVDSFAAGKGTVRVAGELWSAELLGGESAKAGDTLKVIARDGLRLTVAPLRT